MVGALAIDAWNSSAIYFSLTDADANGAYITSKDDGQDFAKTQTRSAVVGYPALKLKPGLHHQFCKDK
ncbi:MAG: hypothetical protein ACFB14_09125 [Leptolyngbyaceae cyanobacterium]